MVPIDEESTLQMEKQISILSNSGEITKFLVGLSANFYQEREKQVGEEVARQMEVFTYLNTIDTLWIEHLDTMDDLRSGIGLRGYAQRDPLIEYKREGFDLFEKMMVEIDFEIVHRIFKVAVQNQAPSIVAAEPIKIDQAVEIRPKVDISIEQETADERPSSVEPLGETKVTIERGGQVIAQETYGTAGQLTKAHGKLGRNDPCWCGNGKKYKKCHYPN